jgi:hypothetical protein
MAQGTLTQSRYPSELLFLLDKEAAWYIVRRDIFTTITRVSAHKSALMYSPVVLVVCLLLCGNAYHIDLLNRGAWSLALGPRAPEFFFD